MYVSRVGPKKIHVECKRTSYRSSDEPHSGLIVTEQLMREIKITQTTKQLTVRGLVGGRSNYFHWPQEPLREF